MAIMAGHTHAPLPLKTPFHQMLAGEAESAILGCFPCDFCYSSRSQKFQKILRTPSKNRASCFLEVWGVLVPSKHIVQLASGPGVSCLPGPTPVASRYVGGGGGKVGPTIC